MFTAALLLKIWMFCDVDWSAVLERQLVIGQLQTVRSTVAFNNKSKGILQVKYTYVSITDKHQHLHFTFNIIQGYS